MHCRTYLPLAGEVSVTGGDTEDERVELGELGGREDGVVGLGGSVQGLEDLLGEGLGDSEQRCEVRNEEACEKTRETHW